MSRIFDSLQKDLKKPAVNVGVVGESSDITSDIAEVSIEAMHIANDEMDLEQVQEVCASLEAIALQAEASIADGGLDRPAAAMMEVAVEGQVSRLGLDAQVPSMESFGASSTRVEATEISVEALKEKVANIWEWIVTKYAELRVKIVKWFHKVFGTAEGVVKRAKALGEKVKGDLTPKDEQKKISLGGGAAPLMDDSGAFAAGNVKSQLEAWKTFGDTIFGGHYNAGKDYVGAATTFFKGLGGLEKESEVKGEAGKVGGVDLPTFDAAITGETKLPGGVIVKAAAGGEGVDAFKKALPTVEMGEAKLKDSKVEFDALDAAGMTAILKVVEEAAEAIVKFKGDFEGQEKLLKDLGEAAKGVDKLKLKYAGDAKSVAQAAYDLAGNVFSKPYTQVMAAELKSLKAGLAVVEKSLGQYK